LKAVSNYKNRSITTISERRSKHASESKKLIEKTATVEAETNQFKVREIELVAGELYILNYVVSP
jgi:kinetochore protein Spc25